MVLFIYTLQWDLHEINKLLIQVRDINVLTCVRCRMNISHGLPLHMATRLAVPRFSRVIVVEHYT
jgi:hypothetical protein